MPSRLRVVTTILTTDLRRIGRDRLALFFLVALPFVLIVAVGSFIPDEDVSVVLGVVDEDNSTASRDLVEELSSTEGVEVRTEFDRRAAERELRIQRLNGVVVLPEGFEESLRGEGGTVEVVVDPAASSAWLAHGVLSEILGERSVELTVERELRAAGVSNASEVSRPVLDGLAASEVDVTLVGDEERESNYNFVAAGQMILFMFVNLLAAGAGFIEMRRLGILGRVAAGPVAAGDVLVGLALSRFVVACGLAAMIIGLAIGLYDVRWGSWAVVVPVVVLFGLVSVGASTLIGAVFDKPDSATSVGVPLGLAMAALGGCMFPLFLAPAPMQVAAKVLTPHAWAVEALLDAGYDGAGPADVWVNLLVLAVWAAVLMGLARVFSRRRLRG